MRELIWGSSFKRALKKTVRQRPDLAPKIEKALARLAAEPFDPALRTHKLKGELTGSWACTVEYDCRIVFDFIPNTETEQEVILLFDIGKHDEVY
jgi:addiction module RelE/StbE family toxin